MVRAYQDQVLVRVHVLVLWVRGPVQDRVLVRAIGPFPGPGPGRGLRDEDGFENQCRFVRVQVMVQVLVGGYLR